MNKPTRMTQPKRVVENLDQPEGLPDYIRTNVHGSRFLFVHYAFGWEFVDNAAKLGGIENGWLPVLSTIRGIAGVNGCYEEGGPGSQRVVMTKAIAGAMAKGGTIIDPKNPALGEHQNYVCEYKLRNGGRYFVTPWEEATVLPNDIVLWNGDATAPDWNAFRAYLRDNILDPMMVEVFAQKMDVERQLLENLEDRAAGAPVLVGRVNKQRDRMTAMQSAWDAWQGGATSDDAPPPPKATKPRKAPAQDAA